MVGEGGIRPEFIAERGMSLSLHVVSMHAFFVQMFVLGTSLGMPFTHTLIVESDTNLNR